MSIIWHITCLLLLRSCTPGFFIHGIVGGKVSVPHSRPYMVYIRDKKTKATCAGFLVREDFVMAAAHCIQSHLMVYLGVDDTNFLPDGVEVDPLSHPEFNMKRPDHDIMLLKLKTLATLNKTVSTITFPKSENEEISKDCTVMGWGWQDYHDESPSNVLREANVTPIDSENCGTTDSLCTEGSTGPAQEDSGGPLVCGSVAQGIVSFYKNKKNGNHLAVYTHISHYLPWIQHIMPFEIPEMSDQVSRPRTLAPTPERWTPKHHKHKVFSVSVPHSRPYMVYIRDKVSKVACSGFLVREDFVMAAVHCKQSHLMVYLGVDDTNFLPDGVEVDPFPHPNFNMDRTDHDIMLLKLKTPATLNKIVSTITLPKTESKEVLKDCMVMGWGWKKYHHESPSNVLKEATVTLIDSENCGTSDTLCTEGSTGPAQGYNGGPLVCGGVAQGIVFYKNKKNGNHLAVYTHISHYLPWIQHAMSFEIPKMSDQVSRPRTLAPTPSRWTPKHHKHQVFSVSVPHSRPYMVYICDKVSKVACSVFLVREDFVMTAAHCKQSHLMVYLGVDDTNLLPNGVDVDPIPHPKFNMKTTGHDIMLVKLKTPANLNKIESTITLPKTESEEVLKDCMVMGWGWKKYHHESPSNVLNEATVTLIDSKNCGTADTLCTEGSSGPAQRHSGGPLVCGGVAQGIVSFFKDKRNADLLTVYTHISHYLPWIQSIMSPETPEMLDQVSTPGILDPTPNTEYQNPSAVFCLVPKT